MEGCKYFVVPKTRTEWWLAKINRTVERDRENKKDKLNSPRGETTNQHLYCSG